jgi:hypothetical protein
MCMYHEVWNLEIPHSAHRVYFCNLFVSEWAVIISLCSLLDSFYDQGLLSEL